ncbi:hypothetical protein PENSPDRAFT_679188 [Peniophora sp. CONT]|nr:hypothetical protein PENSPDRAFT_679188 [Peniophora sp. CONT]
MQYSRKSTSSAGHSTSKYGVGAGISSASIHGGSSVRTRPSGSAEFEVRTVTVPGRKKTSQSQASQGRRSKDTHVEEAESTEDHGEDEREYEFIRAPSPSGASSHQLVPVSPPSDKASRILGIRHSPSMEPIPASTRTSVASTRSARERPPSPTHTPTTPLTSLYVVSGLPKAAHTWTLADADSVMGLAHSEGAVNRWWRAEVLGSTISPGAGGGRRRRRGGKGAEVVQGAGALSKQETAKLLAKTLKLSFTRELEIVASTLQPASTVHTFSFAIPAAPANPALAASQSNSLLRTIDRPTSALYAHPRPSTAYLGPNAHKPSSNDSPPSTVTYHGVCLTVWSHADSERSQAIRRTLESNRSRKESTQSLVQARLRSLRADAHQDPSLQARRSARKAARGPWGASAAQTDGETDFDNETDGGVSESDFDVASTVQGHNPGESTLFLPGDTVFWLPYALTLVSRHPIYDLMRDYLTLSWARFSKDVQSHTLQISKILSHPAPRPGDLIKLDASAAPPGALPAPTDTSLEVIARFPGGLDFGRGLVDINFTMWPLFKALNLDNILTICEIALAPTGRVLFFSRHPAMLGIAVLTIKYLVELRGWNGIALQAVHSRDAKIYIDDPGPWIMGLATEARYSVRPPPEVCVVDIDINYLSCAMPPPGLVSQKAQRDKYRARLLQAFEPHYHGDHGVPAELKEAFPAGRFRPVCKIQAKRGGNSAAVADAIKAPEWWHSTRVIQAFDAVLQDHLKRPSLLKRLSGLGGVGRRTPQKLSAAEQTAQLSIRKRATAFVDARDELETKIGRLSRRLNFLVTESDLWRDKFVAFEGHAEKLAAEAAELRSRINREQRETRRLSGLVTMTAAEKSRLQGQLRDTEGAHLAAVQELTEMREMMESMEEERAQMVAEVEAQIERALASMAIGSDADDDLDDDDASGSEWGAGPSSRPGSRSGSRAGSRSSRRTGDKHLRSFGTDSTLADSYAGMHGVLDDTLKIPSTGLLDVQEEEDEQPLTPSRTKRFSASVAERPNTGDRFGAHARPATASTTAEPDRDAQIEQRTDHIARKVAHIQSTLESAAALVGTEVSASASASSSADESAAGYGSERLSAHRRARNAKKQSPLVVGKPPTRRRAGTDSSRGTARVSLESEHTTQEPPTPTRPVRAPTPTESKVEQQPEKHLTPLRRIASDASVGAMSPLDPSFAHNAQAQVETPTTPALTPTFTGTTDESDTDFQSAYSASPRESYAGHDVGEIEDEDEAEGGDTFLALESPSSDVPFRMRGQSERARVGSSVTITAAHINTPQAKASPTLSEHTVNGLSLTPPPRPIRRIPSGNAVGPPF